MTKLNVTYKILFAAICICLFIYSIVFAKERILLSDTSGYLIQMINGEHFIVPTNRFISILSQVLPLAGILAGLPLSVLVVLYSVNFILIPVVFGLLSILLFKNWKIAISILLFYTLMSTKLFYYPVSELQMGLCLLLFYHAFFLNYADLKFKKNVAVQLINLLLIVTIVFSHPLSVLVFFFWAIWLVFLLQGKRKLLLIYPVVIAIIALFIKETYFKAFLNHVAYDVQRAEGLRNFFIFYPHYFEGNLFESFLKIFVGEYFMVIVLFLLLFLFLLKNKKVIQSLLLLGTCFCFFLLVTVSFRDHIYDHYYEHLYQPLPFFIAFAVSYIDLNLSKQMLIKFCVILAVFTISLIKIKNGHIFYERRLVWYQHYLDLMKGLKVQKAALSRGYITIGTLSSYWSAPSETLLLSSLPGPDSSATLFLVWNFASLQQNLQDSTIIAYDGSNVPLSVLNPKYFRLNHSKPYTILDSVINKATLNCLSHVP